MSITPAQPGKLSAILLLNDAVRLAGQLSSLLDGRLQLDAVRTLGSPDSATPINIESGSLAMLSLPGAGSAQRPLEDARVRVSGLARDSITLEFAVSDTDVAARYREAIACGCAPGLASTSRPIIVAATAAYTALLEQLETQSLKDLKAALTPFLTDLTGYLL
ncbi:MAG TPA: hypothetical protein VIV27_00055, partial [Halioglobus sp.]